MKKCRVSHILSIWLIDDRIDWIECKELLTKELEGYTEQFIDFLMELVNHQGMNNKEIVETYVKKLFAEIEGLEEWELDEYMQEFDYDLFVKQSARLTA